MSAEVRVAVRLLREDALEIGVSLPLHLHYKFILGSKGSKKSRKSDAWGLVIILRGELDFGV